MIERHRAAPSLSIVLPVFNGQTILVSRVTKLLEIASDLAIYFEVVVVDDGSTDQTEEVAVELFRRFPQVLFARHPHRLGHEAAAHTGAKLGTGEYIFLIPEDAPLRANHIRSCWNRREHEGAEFCTSPLDARESTLIDRLKGWASHITPPSKASSSSHNLAAKEQVQIFYRDSIPSWEKSAENSSIVQRQDPSREDLQSPPHRGSMLKHLRDLAVGE